MPRSPTRPLALVIAVLACQPKAEEPKTGTPRTNADEVPTQESAPAEVQDPATPDSHELPEAPVEAGLADPAIVYFVGARLWRVDADGSERRALGLEVSPENPGMDQTVGQGDSVPTISRDGRWLAWVDSVDLWIAEFGPAGPTEHQITKMPAQQDDWIKAASIAYSSWSPDSSTLIVHLAEPGYLDEEPLPLPSGVAYGFQVLRATELALVRAQHIEAVEGWTPDSKAVLASRYVGKNDYRLTRYSVDRGPAQELRTTTDGYGFAQLDVNHDWLAWTDSQGGSQILVAPLAGGEPKPMSPTAAFADIQYPLVAPDGAHVLFQHQQQPQLGAGPEAPKPLDGVTQARWYDAGHLLALTGEGLVLLDLDGKAQPLDPAATGLVRQ